MYFKPCWIELNYSDLEWTVTNHGHILDNDALYALANNQKCYHSQLRYPNYWIKLLVLDIVHIEWTSYPNNIY
jgi:hypothetical protein